MRLRKGLVGALICVNGVPSFANAGVVGAGGNGGGAAGFLAALAGPEGDDHETLVLVLGGRVAVIAEAASAQRETRRLDAGQESDGIQAAILARSFFPAASWTGRIDPSSGAGKK